MTTDNTNTTRNDSLAARTDTWLQSLLVWSPGQRDIIKTVALVLMVPGGRQNGTSGAGCMPAGRDSGT